MNKIISLKIQSSASVKVVLERINQFPGVVITECVFPDAVVGSQLGGLHVMEVESSALEEVLAKLKQDPDVDFAYEPPIRKTSI